MLYIISIIAILILDIITKYLTVAYLKPISTYPIIQDVFHLTYIENTGAAFSVLQDKQIFLILFNSILLFLLFAYLVRALRRDRKFHLSYLALSFIIAGGIGNLIDRFRLGYVIDMFDFRLINFAVFNVADIFICAGVVLLVLCILFFEKDLVR